MSPDDPVDRRILTRPADVLWMTALGVLAVSLRLWHLGHGLPEFSEEAIVFRKALELWGPSGQGSDLHPHSFVYPSLTIYLHLLLQHFQAFVDGVARPADYLLGFLVDPTPAVLLARSVGVAADLITLLLVGRIARRYGAVASVAGMALVALAPALIRTSRLIYCDPVMCALALAAVHRMLVYGERGGRQRLLIAGALVGLATGAKYPAILLLVPLGLVVWRREAGRERLVGLAGAGLAALAVFGATTPYAFVSGTEVARDILLHRDVTLEGALGMLAGTGAPYYLRGMLQNLGWFGAGLLVVSLLPRRSNAVGATVLLLWVCLVAFFAPIALARVEAERYLLPVVALGAVLVGAGLDRLSALVPTVHRRAATTIALALLLAPALWVGARAAASGRSSTELEARRWLERNAGPGDLVLSEAYGPALLARDRAEEVRGSELFAAASPALRERYAAQTAYHFVWLPLIVSGYMGVPLGPEGAPEVPVYAHAADWNGAVYDLRLLAGVDYVVTTSSVRDRFAMDPTRFGEQRRFYGFLDRQGEKVAEFASGWEVEGPRVTIHRLGGVARDSLRAAGPPDSLWWARTVPESFRAAATASLRPADDESGRELPGWARTLRRAYAERYAGFADGLAGELVSLGRFDCAAPLCDATLRILPEDVGALQRYAESASVRGRWRELARAVDRTVAAFRRAGGVPPQILFLKAEVLMMTGAPDAAGALLRDLLRCDDPEISAAAERALRHLSPRAH